ncbi:epimerase [Kitasatospora sp. MMS16-BH015]|uniref:PhzF family phenazine biosynthesis protein n=1 Tax=Kitasatospora sp. MMS16-BH015 TaxID=2018025 RepID=UPI000CA16378|nr:PhzF family phenazine biosynthesis protein [Kitasatospora sp. MMS16-BH015]AUG80968.1 epimerase [Kitasatospora sp. MMS16-BH015]
MPASASGPSVTLVHACLREGRGGSPTAVLPEDPSLTDEQRRRVPALAGTSHAVFVEPATARLRFFTTAGELPACGHGTVAALAWLATRPGHRSLPGSRVRRQGDHHTVEFTPGPVTLRPPTPAELTPVLAALGLAPADLAPGARLATLGRPRLLLPLHSRARLAALSPDFAALGAATHRLGLLGCYLHTAPDPRHHLAARMFAPAIGVPEDIANANSTACLAAHLGLPTLTVQMGDSLSAPATLTATPTTITATARVADTPKGPHRVDTRCGPFAARRVPSAVRTTAGECSPPAGPSGPA